MFLPQTDAVNAEIRASEQARREGYSRIELWVTEAIPSELRQFVTISVQEVECGDPDCSPIDTAIAILFSSGGRGLLGIPLESKDVSKESLLEVFPTTPVLAAWARGEDAEWPPMEDDDEDDIVPRPRLRFDIGKRVVCRVGPDPVTGWAAGRVVQLWYREPSWPANSWAPYKIELEDGRNIFSPGDVDQIIREV
mmetsp:Transcript_10311/g.18526  ORF Transcript_10311/g.18526 Transcript_10311/m.18526 type:complete len:195 (+) Transcript_10311:120-704(+)|eukprot:CAMPEP_0201638918 /NCGR_PEP_ID=MMETSP0493-20130528/17911_1 /ASSEMBLY_ACC=CAM_ASM_000838 /TAXON_ID=420259 /ORGANISM="Thalassiosira gravida, Strain GMp14c1" /LENGTH=194 /DNA_ID=CAMNT_0048112133 /DNA_START=99 /DNA_END=683 /DNA_ORIENTATION=-